MSRTVLVLSLGLLSGLASAQERPNEDFLRVWGQHASAASGAKGPQEIPYGSAMERFFWTIGREHGLGTPAHAQRLRTVLPVTDADARVIGEIAAQSYDVSATVRHEATVQYDELCAQLLDSPGTRNAVDVGMQFNAVERRKAERLTAHYQAALARLSPAARAALNAHVDNSVWPKMTWGRDLVGLALEVPDAFLAHRVKVCERRLATPVGERLWRYEQIPITPVLSEVH